MLKNKHQFNGLQMATYFDNHPTAPFLLSSSNFNVTLFLRVCKDVNTVVGLFYAQLHSCHTRCDINLISEVEGMDV